MQPGRASRMRMHVVHCACVSSMATYRLAGSIWPCPNTLPEFCNAMIACSSASLWSEDDRFDLKLNRMHVIVCI